MSGQVTRASLPVQATGAAIDAAMRTRMANERNDLNRRPRPMDPCALSPRRRRMITSFIMTTDRARGFRGWVWAALPALGTLWILARGGAFEAAAAAPPAPS